MSVEPTGLPAESNGEADGGANSARKPPAAPYLRLNRHAFLCTQRHTELPDLPLLVDTGADVSMLPSNWLIAIPEAERLALAGSPLQLAADNQTLRE